MQCTPQEIEEKKRIAQLKLQSKRKRNDNFSTTNVSDNQKLFPGACNYTGTSSPNKQFRFKPYTHAKPTLPFYGITKTITANFYLISASRFAVTLSEYSSAVIDIFKTIPSRSYNIQTKTWDFDTKDYLLLENKLVSLQPGVVLSTIPAFALKCCQQSKSNYDEIDISDIDPELLSTLMPFQLDGVRFGIDKNGRCLIADDMGLGKTLQALGIANYYKTDWPLLIITTSSMKNIWETAIHKYLPTVPLIEIQYMISGKDYIGGATILIVSHDMASRALDKLREKQFGVIIIDESHIFKNYKAKCTRAAESLANQAKRLILLSGTPALSRPSELYTQLSLIDNKFFGNFYHYSKRYCDGKSTIYGWDASGQSNLQELEVILNNKFMIRRTKEDVLKMLPNKKHEIITLDIKLNYLTEEDGKYLSSLAARYNNTKKQSEKHAALLTFFGETAKAKIPSVCSYISQVVDQTDKFLVFAHHKVMLDAIQQILSKKNKKFIRIDGSTTSEQRRHFVEKFQVDDTCMCAILSITAANAGITLTSAQLIIFAELHWNPSILSQAESRAHRIGQESEVTVRYLLAPGTADDPMWQLLLEKQKTLKQIGLLKDSFDNMSINIQKLSTGSTEHPNRECTNFDTLDISCYFDSPRKSTSASKCDNSTSTITTDLDCFNDGMDDYLLNLDI